jgi:predicted RNA-binding protein YlqC (UPF0109 family)
MNSKIENAITKTVRALYSKPRLNPTVDIFRRGRRLEIEVDVSPWNPGLLIGERGSMKFAIQLLIAYAFGFDTERGVNIHVSSSKKKEITRTEPSEADGAKLKPLADAIAILLDGRADIDQGSKSVMVHFFLPRDIARDVKPPLSKVIRAAGKAAGFNALPYIDVGE